MTPRERAMEEIVRRETALLGPAPSGVPETLDYLRRMYEGGDRILHAKLPAETVGERLRRWLVG